MSPIQQAIVFELGVWALVFARMHLSLPDASKDLPGLYASDLKNNVCNFSERSLTKSRLGEFSKWVLFPGQLRVARMLYSLGSW